MDRRFSPGRMRVVASGFGPVLAAVIALSCNDLSTTPRDPTPPLVFETRLPRALAAAGPEAALQLVPFDRVRITFRRLTGVVALDTTFAIQPDADSVAVKLHVPLQLALPVLGETMTLVVTCINGQGVAVYRGGPVVISVHPGVAPAPVVIQLAYVGAGSVASTIRLVPDALSVLLGQPFSFTATVFDASGVPIADAPVVWSVLEPALARLTSPLGGVGAALTTPGVAHIVAEVPDGPADTASLTIQPLPALPPLIASSLQFTTSLANAIAGAPLTTTTARALDDAGQLVTSFTSAVTIALGNNPGGATLSGTRTVTAVNGVATFSSLSLDKVASGYTLVATAAGVPSVTSNAFSISHAAASVLAIAGGNNQTGLVSALLGSPLAAKVTDAFDNPVSGVTVAWSVLAGGGLLGSATTQTNASGIASSTWTLGLLAGAQRVTASASGLTGSPLTYSATATALAPVATKLAISALQSTAVAGTTLTGVIVRATDDAGQVVGTFASDVSISLGSNSGGAALSGTRTVRAANGVATFSDLSLDKVASGYTLVASASGLTSVTSSAFSITHAAASVLSIAGGNNQSALLSALLPNPITVLVTDAFGNPVPGQSVSWAVTLGGGLLGVATTQTNASGIASNTWTLGLLLGLQHATAAASGLSGSPATFSASALLGDSPSASALLGNLPIVYSSSRLSD